MVGSSLSMETTKKVWRCVPFVLFAGAGAGAGLAQDVRALEFHRSLTEDQRRVVERDLENLCRLDYGKDFANKASQERLLKRFLGVDSIDCGELGLALGRSIDLLTGHLGPGDLLFAPKRGLDNATVRRMVDRLAEEVDRGLVAMNVGPALVDRWGRMQSEFARAPSRDGRRPGIELHVEYADRKGGEHALPIREASRIIALSPRFFLSPNHPDPDVVDTLANSIYRIGVLVHEAVHGMPPHYPHVPCDGWGGSDCDDVFHGPFGRQALFLLYALDSCGECGGEAGMRLYLSAYHSLAKLNGDACGELGRLSGLDLPCRR